LSAVLSAIALATAEASTKEEASREGVPLSTVQKPPHNPHSPFHLLKFRYGGSIRNTGRDPGCRITWKEIDMRGMTILAGVIIVAALAAVAPPATAHDIHPGGGCWTYPVHERWHDHDFRYGGPWTRPGYGYGRRGYGPHEYGPRGYGWWGPDRSVFGETISEGEAEKLIEWLIRGNPNLEVGKVTEVEGGYHVQVVTRKGGSLVDTLMVEQDTARVYPVYE
jgi:hypothetical protein